MAWLTLLMSWPAPAGARDAVVRSFDTTPIVVHFYEAAGLTAGQRAPSVLVGPGYPNRGNTDPTRRPSDQIGVSTLRAAGYNAITWDPRGLGGSGGKVMFDSPDFEGRDVQAIVTYVGNQPEALLDAPGDPRVGMSGSSYGGAIQLVSAAIEPRIDAIVPDLAWHSFDTNLFKDGAAKVGWLAVICAGGELNGLLDGAFFGPAGIQLSGVDTHLTVACLEGLANGTASGASRNWLAARGPAGLLSKIRAPTLITQGVADTLVPLADAIANYEALRANGVTAKMLWHCGGHGACPGGQGEPGHVPRAGLAWLDRWLKRDATIDTGPAFEWVSDDGRQRSAPGYPLAPAGTIDAVGSGSLLISPLDGISTTTLRATTAGNAVSVAFPLAPPGSDLVGAPVVKLTYRGTAVPARTHLYAQVVNAATNDVLGGLVTPIQVILDGRTRTVERPLEVIAAHSQASSAYRLQIAAGSAMYGVQRSVGAVTLSQIAASLPLGDASGPKTVALVTPRRLRIVVSSRRTGAVARVSLRSRLRSRPCSGIVAFRITAGDVTRRRRTRVHSNCRVHTVVGLRVRPGSRARVTARYEGNGVLAPRRAHPVSRLLK